MIRQAISCDICGKDKQQTNRWWLVYDQGGEFRISVLNTKNRLRPGAKHLCGQTCLHKLVDEFMARMSAGRLANSAAETQPAAAAPRTDTSLINPAAHTPQRPVVMPAIDDGFESSARLISAEEAARLKRSASVSAPPRPARPQPAPSEPPNYARPLPPEPVPAHNARTWHADAWKRERERARRSIA